MNRHPLAHRTRALAGTFSLPTLAMTLTMALTSCGPARWNELANNAALPINKSTVPGSPGTTSQTRTYETKAVLAHDHTLPLDIVWVIDNSPSMAEEAAHVRRNFQKFIDAVKSHSNLKVALISRKGDSGTDVALESTEAERTQVNRYVWSTDSLEITASTICTPTAKSGTICEKIRSGARTDVSKISGNLRSFLRTGSKKAFVFVTDDESRVTARSFLDSFSESFPGQLPVVYGFIGLSKTISPCAARTGSQYAALASATAGDTYNICNQDWTSSFKKLADNVIRWASTPVPVPGDLTTAQQIVFIELNGKRLDPSQYTLTPQGLLFDAAIAEQSPEALLRVQYTVPGTN